MNAEEDLTWSLSNERLAENFRKIATENEFRAVEGKIQKWSSPINVFIGKGGVDSQKEIQEIFDDISKMTGLDIILGGSKENINFFISFDEARNIPSVAKKISKSIPQYQVLYDAVSPYDEYLFVRGRYCYGTYLSDPGGHIKQALVMIPIEYTGEVRRSCLIEEIVQSLGLPNDSFNVSPSIFNDSEDYKELTDQDILFLRILYSNNIVSGKYYEYNKNSIFKVIQKYREQNQKS